MHMHTRRASLRRHISIEDGIQTDLRGEGVRPTGGHRLRRTWRSGAEKAIVIRVTLVHVTIVSGKLIAVFIMNKSYQYVGIINGMPLGGILISSGNK